MSNEKATCPYCGCKDCEAEWVDVGVGEIQSSPYICPCGAVEMGLEQAPDDLTEGEKRTGWYSPSRFGPDPSLSPPPGVNTMEGEPVDASVAKGLRRFGLLDKKPEPVKPKGNPEKRGQPGHCPWCGASLSYGHSRTVCSESCGGGRRD